MHRVVQAERGTTIHCILDCPIACSIVSRNSTFSTFVRLTKVFDRWAVSLILFAGVTPPGNGKLILQCQVNSVYPIPINLWAVSLLCFKKIMLYVPGHTNHHTKSEFRHSRVVIHTYKRLVLLCMCCWGEQSSVSNYLHTITAWFCLTILYCTIPLNETSSHLIWLTVTKIMCSVCFPIMFGFLETCCRAVS